MFLTSNYYQLFYFFILYINRLCLNFIKGVYYGNGWKKTRANVPYCWYWRKQFDLDITLANDHRDVIYGIVRDCFKEPVRDAVVKLVEIEYKCGKKELKPVSHTFTDEDGEFVFGPLCPGKKYAVQIWANQVKHIKICAKCHHEGKCLKGVDLDCDKKDFPHCDRCSKDELEISDSE